jgi:tRNA(fMet)-specific endonuclease VapC
VVVDVVRRTLLDTDIFSELMRGKNEVVWSRADAYVKQHGRLTISVITVLEVAKGLQKAGRQDALARFVGTLASLEVLTMGPEEAVLGGRIYGDLERLGQPIGRADPMIAGIAVLRGFALATGNEEHYARIQAAGYDLVIDNWRTSPRHTTPG